MQSTFVSRSSVASAISDVWLIPFVSNVNPYLSTNDSYVAMADTEFASLVVYRIPIVLASGIISRIIFSCSSTGSVSEVPVTLPTGLPSLSASSAATGSVTAVYTTGISLSIAALYALCALGVAIAQIRSILSDTKESAI